MRTSVLKDGHVFSVHILNPREGEEETPDPDLQPPNPAAKTEEPEKAELEKSEKGSISKNGVRFTARWVKSKTVYNEAKARK